MDGQQYVSGSIIRLKKRLQERGQDADSIKESVMRVVGVGTAQFEKKIISGEVEISSLADYERLIKLGLLVTGNPTEKIEHSTDIEEVQTVDYDQVKNTEEFSKVKEMLAEMMNKRNEEA